MLAECWCPPVCEYMVAVRDAYGSLQIGLLVSFVCLLGVCSKVHGWDFSSV